MEASIDCDWLPSARTLTPKTNDLLLKGDWFSPIATKEIDFSYIALGRLMILILTVTGPEKKASYNSHCQCVCLCECVCSPACLECVCVCASMKSIPGLFYPAPCTTVSIRCNRLTITVQVKQRGTKGNQRLFTSAKTSLNSLDIIGSPWVCVLEAWWHLVWTFLCVSMEIWI